MAFEVPWSSVSGALGGPTGSTPPAVTTSGNPADATSSANSATFVGLSTARNIGGFSADVVVEETANDSLVITDHPVEIGATISDHAYKLVPDVRIRAGWTETLRGEGYSAGVYDKLLALQLARTPITVVTGKRIYKNMLIASLMQRTTHETEYSLMIDFTLRQVNLVRAQTVQIDASKAANPADNAPVTPGGPQQPAAADNHDSRLLQGSKAVQAYAPSLGPPTAAAQLPAVATQAGPLSTSSGAGI